MKCLFLLSLCLLPIVVFSSTFTSQNPIKLPNAAAPVAVVDTTGKELDTNSSYRMISVFWGALGGDVYLDKSPNSNAPCDNGVFRYNSDLGPKGTPVRLIASSDHIYEEQDINIQFDIATSKSCVIYTIWKRGDYDISVGANLVETGGKSPYDSVWFKIVKSSIVGGYNLLYCFGEFYPVSECSLVGVVPQEGRRRLAISKDNPLIIAFEQVD